MLLFFLPPCSPGGMIGKFNALGKNNHAQEWDKKGIEMVRAFISDREGDPIENYRELNREEMQTIIEGMS